jgi:hypothetical protein
MFIDSAFISLGYYCIEVKTVYYASFVFYPLFAFAGISIAVWYKLIDTGGFDDVRWLFTILTSFVFILLISVIIKIIHHQL